MTDFCAGKFSHGDIKCEKPVFVRQHLHVLHLLVTCFEFSFGYFLCFHQVDVLS